MEEILKTLVTKKEFEDRFERLDRRIDERFAAQERDMKEYYEETKRFMGMLHEDMRHQFRTALEILEPLAPRVPATS